MAYKYIVAIANGTNFIHYEDNNAITIVGYPGNLYAVTDDDLGQSWINRVGGVEKTKVEAQAIVDTAVDVEQVAWDNDSQPIEETPLDGGGKGYRPGDVTLP